MKELKICVVVVLVAVAIAVWACLKMSGDSDRREEKEDAEQKEID